MTTSKMTISHGFGVKMQSSSNWLYDSCANWLDKKCNDFKAVELRLKLITAAKQKGLTVEQVSQTIHQVNEDRRNERERFEQLREDAKDNENTVVAEEATAATPTQQHPVRTSTSKGETSASGTKITGAAGGKSILGMADERKVR